MSAGRFRFSVSPFPLLCPARPICMTNFPARVNFRIWWIVLAVTTDPYAAARVHVHAVLGRGPPYPSPGPPQAWTRLPSESNSNNGGAALSCSSGPNVPGRCSTHT